MRIPGPPSLKSGPLRDMSGRKQYLSPDTLGSYPPVPTTGFSTSLKMRLAAPSFNTGLQVADGGKTTQNNDSGKEIRTMAHGCDQEIEVLKVVLQLIE